MSVVEVEVAAPSVVEADEVAATLERAADLLVEKGWTQGVTFRNTGAMCARGAILTATVGQSPRLNEDAEDRLARYLDVDSVVAWNDSMNMAAEDVIRAFKEAAACHATTHPKGF